MRIVPNLNDISECPNCHTRRGGLTNCTNDFGRPFLLCMNCQETFYESETTCSEEQYAVYCVKKDVNAEEERLKRKKKEKENFIFEMRGEISYLTWLIHDSKTQTLIENIQNIFNRIIDYIEEN